MAVNRVLYATQTANVFTGGTGVTGFTTRRPYTLPTQSANADETIPQDDVLVLGKLGGVARLQKDVASCKASLKFYMCQSITVDESGAGHNASGWLQANRKDGEINGNLLRDFLKTTIAAAQAGVNDRVIVDSSGTGLANSADGFYMDGIVNSIGIDASKGAFPMIDMAWEGVGRLQSLNMGTAATLVASNGGDWHITEANPITSKEVVVSSATNDTVANVKFSYDLPTETLSRLGGVILGNSATVAGDNQQFSKPPYKATMTADGQSLAGVAGGWGTACSVTFGTTTTLIASISAAGLNISTKSFGQNVGDVGATFSVTAEGTEATFA